MDVHFFARISVRCPRFVESAFSWPSESQGTNAGNRLPPAMGFLSITTRTNLRYLARIAEFFMVAIPRA